MHCRVNRRKNSVVALAGALLALGATSRSDAAFLGLYDPGFESESPGTAFGDSGATNGVWSSFGAPKYAITASESHSGSNSVESSPGSGLYQFEISTVGDGSDLYGQTVDYSFWVIDPSGTGSLNWQFDARDTATNVYSAQANGTVVGSNDTTYQEISGSFVVPVSTTTTPNALVVTLNGATGGPFYADDFSLNVATVPEPASLGFVALSASAGLLRRRRPANA
jgi:hypothetical protein